MATVTVQSIWCEFGCVVFEMRVVGQTDARNNILHPLGKVKGAISREE